MICVYTEHVYAVFYKAMDGLFAENVLHPARSDDSQALAVSDVIVRAEGVLDSVARPALIAVAESVNPVAAVGAGQHHLGSRGIIIGIFKALHGICHKAL